MGAHFTPEGRVKELIAVVQRELGQKPTRVVVESDDWDWFAGQAIKGDNPHIRFDQSALKFNDVIIKRHR